MSETDPAPPTPRRRRYTFRLRALMLLVAIMALALGWRVNRAHTQARAVARVKQAGGQVWYDYEFDGTYPYKNLSAPRVPAWLRRMVGDEYFQEVTRVSFHGKTATDAALAPVEDLDHLVAIEIRDASNVTDAGLAHLAGLPRHQEVSLRNMPRITDAGLERLAGMTGLRRLSLSWCVGITDAGLRAHLPRLTGLRELTLSGPAFGGAGPAFLEHMKELRKLSLFIYGANAPGLANEDLAHLAGLTELQELDLSTNKRITAAGLRHLRGLRQLRELRLDYTWVSDPAIADLQATIPGLAVSRVGRPFW